MIDIEKMEAAALAATQGEWVVSDHIYASDGKRIASYQMISRDDCENEANATHIATANPSAVLELIEKYKALEAENERLKGINSALCTKSNSCLIQNARLEEERDELKRQLAEAKLSLTPQEPPEGLVPYGHSLEPTRQNADFWYKAGHSEEAKHKGESVICMAQAVFAWKNAAYAKAEKEMLLENQIAELAEWNNQIGRTNYELRKQLEGEIKQLKDQCQSEYSRGWAEALVIAAQLCHNEAKLKLAQDILNLVERKNT